MTEKEILITSLQEYIYWYSKRDANDLMTKEQTIDVHLAIQLLKEVSKR